MKNHNAQFDTELTKLKGVKLSRAQKESMRARIYKTTPIPSPFMALMHSRVVVAFTAFFMVLGSVSYVSANSMPGDLFYGVKARVLDPIAQVFVREKKEEDAPHAETFQTLSVPSEYNEEPVLKGSNDVSADARIQMPVIEVEIATSTVSGAVDTPAVDVEVRITPEETNIQVETPVGETGLSAPALPVTPPSTPNLGL